ncbi:MAG: condensation domain-containing protein, partial [Citricoccus sp.]
MPLNAAQLGVWTAEAVQETNDAFQIAQLMWIDAPLDADCFRQAAETVGREAEILRTRPEDGGDTGPALKANAAPPAIRVIAEPQTDEEISRLVSEHARARSAGADPFGTGFTLYTRTGGGSCWALNTHHLLLDAYGVGLVTRRVAEVYTALTEGREVPAAWFAPAEALAGVGSPEETTHGDADESLLRSWAAVLTAAEDDLPAGGRGQRRFSSDPSAAAAVLGSDLASSVDEVAGLARVSWSDLLTTAWGLYCAQLEGRSSFSVRLFRMNRADRVALTAPGMCVTSVPVVFALDPGMGFRELLGQARARIRSAVTSPVVGEELLARQWPHGTADYYGITQVNIKAFDYDYRFGGSRGRQETITSGP